MKKSDRVILYLFYVYAFILSFEDILEVLWDIKTPYKPFRLLAIGIGFLIIFTRRFNSIRIFTNDLKLLGVYVLGLIPTVIAFLNNRLDEGYFWSTSLQFFITLWIFLLIKSLPFEMKHIHRALHIYCLGALLNGVYMIYRFMFINSIRQSGFMDDSNMASFSCCVSFTYFFYYFVRSEESLLSLSRILNGFISLILMFALFVSGSRTAIVAWPFIVLFLLYYKVPYTKKLWHSAILSIILFFIFSSSNNLSLFKIMPAWNRLINLEGKEDSRLSLWKHGFSAFKDTYFMGLGIEQFKNPVNYTKFVKVSDNAMVINQKGLVVHNAFLTVLYEYGILSFLFFISFFWTLFARLKVACKSIDHPAIYQLLYFNMIWFSIFLSSFPSHTMWFLYIVLGLVAYSKINTNEISFQKNKL